MYMTPEEANKKIKLMGLKKSHVAKRIGCRVDELSHFLNGRRGLRPEVKQELINYIG